MPRLRAAPQLVRRRADMTTAAATTRYALVCHPAADTGRNAEWTYWADRDEAQAACDELTPCGPHCAGVHTIAAVRTGE
jgi:hypothetical protein